MFLEGKTQEFFASHRSQVPYLQEKKEASEADWSAGAGVVAIPHCRSISWIALSRYALQGGELMLLNSRDRWDILCQPEERRTKKKGYRAAFGDSESSYEFPGTSTLCDRGW